MFKRILLRSFFVFCGALFASSISVAATMTLSNGEVLNDPTQPSNWAKPKKVSQVKRSYKLNYLLYADDRKQAIINGKSVVEGDRVSGAKVIKISENSVTLSTESGSKVLRWKQPASIKRTR